MRESEGVRNARQAVQDSFRCLHLPGHFISSLGRVMHLPELCKMHNQAFKYTPREWTMRTRVGACAASSNAQTHNHMHSNTKRLPL